MKKFTSVERYADNGAFSHYELIDENGETVIKDIIQAALSEVKVSVVFKCIYSDVKIIIPANTLNDALETLESITRDHNHYRLMPNGNEMSA